MRWNSITVKLGLAFILFFIVVIFPLGFSINKIFYGFFYNEVENQIDNLSTRYSRSITDIEDEQIINMFERLADLTDHEIFIVNKNGMVIANSGLPSIPKGSVINTPFWEPLKGTGTIKMEFKDSVTKKRYLSIGKPIIINEKFQGGIYVLAPTDNIYTSLDRVRNMLLLAGIGAIFLAVGFTFFLTRKLTTPLLEMEKATRDIAHGHLNTKVIVESKDEIGSLARAINYLAVELNHYQTNRREFFANISHELRTPLTYLGGYTKAIQEGLYQSEEEKSQYLSIIEKETNRMTKLVNDLFELSKMEEGKLDFHFEDIDLYEVVQSAILKTELKAKEKRIEILLEGEEGLPAVRLDGLRTEQIVINLLENAIRYTEYGSITVRLWREKQQIKLTIEDTGSGIPKEDLPYLFERFYRVEKSRSRATGGTGLGLSIVKSLVEFQKGKIYVKSVVGKGTTFVLAFPVIDFNEGD
ncbi:sensor histidine kinase [Cytobacillus firmus]|uniref:histidine kinase n=1 Tax=Cytobacillus firmus TaxID=1399 RepID=A0AA46SM71_CYTFI|nr:cell wall metabolism sensor histidine kinase WalK [Cytobacillus firmus]UYG98090.1 cell wall metabolism sensor histidine kinase WalK [Cytobacillus firmus]